MQEVWSIIFIILPFGSKAQFNGLNHLTNIINIKYGLISIPLKPTFIRSNYNPPTWNQKHPETGMLQKITVLEQCKKH